MIYDDLRLAAIEAILDDTATLLGNHQGPGLQSRLLMTSHFHVTKYHWDPLGGFDVSLHLHEKDGAGMVEGQFLSTPLLWSRHKIYRFEWF